jgi:hypothetical protein
MYSHRQRALVQLVLEAARDGRFCYQSGNYWVIVRRGTDDMVMQVNFAAATTARLNLREGWEVRRANPPRRDQQVIRTLEHLLGAESEQPRMRTIL